MNIAVLVVSCDKYSDLWVPFWTQFDRYWSNFSGKKYLATNHLNPKIDGVEIIQIGDDRSYSENLLSIVEHVKEDYFLYLFEDVFLDRKINNEAVIEIFKKAVSGINFKSLKISDDYPLSYANASFGTLPMNIMYRGAVGMTLYSKSFFKTRLKPGMSAWDLDKAKDINNIEEGILSLTRKGLRETNLGFKHLLIKGKWNHGVLEWLTTEQVCGLNKRSSLGVKDIIYLKLFQFLFRILGWLRVYI